MAESTDQELGDNADDIGRAVSQRIAEYSLTLSHKILLVFVKPPFEFTHDRRRLARAIDEVELDPQTR